MLLESMPYLMKQQQRPMGPGGAPGGRQGGYQGNKPGGQQRMGGPRNNSYDGRMQNNNRPTGMHQMNMQASPANPIAQQ